MSCFRDEQAARSTLEKEWSGFSSAQKALCDRLEKAGGMPSYVEYLTCLEMGKAASGLPKDFTETAIPQIESTTATVKPKRTKRATRGRAIENSARQRNAPPSTKWCFVARA